MSTVIASINNLDGDNIIIALEKLGDLKLDDTEYRISVSVNNQIDSDVFFTGTIEESLEKFRNTQIKYFGRVLKEN